MNNLEEHWPGRNLPCRNAIRQLLSHMDSTSPDVILLDTNWPERALLRAQLIEEGCDVVAIEAWPMPSQYRQPDMKPRIMVIDLQGLADPQATLDEARLVVPSDRVLVVTALGTLAAEDVRRSGFAVIERPATVGGIVATAGAMISRLRHHSQGQEEAI